MNSEVLFFRRRYDDLLQRQQAIKDEMHRAAQRKDMEKVALMEIAWDLSLLLLDYYADRLRGTEEWTVVDEEMHQLPRVKEAILECQVNAALADHDLGPFEPVENEAGRGWQAECRNCERSVLVTAEGEIATCLYDWLSEPCPDDD